jgi:hypothetical protein
MGLDMFLSRKVFLWRDQRKSLQITGMKSKINPEKVEYIIEEFGYWRKANAIHQWFVENVQGGNDDCKSYYVSKEDMQKLLDTVNKVLQASELIDGDVHNGTLYKKGKAMPVIEKGKIIKDSTVAAELLPSTEGFFFGSTDYDQYYYDDLVQTKKILEEALTFDEGEFEYQASW